MLRNGGTWYYSHKNKKKGKNKKVVSLHSFLNVIHPLRLFFYAVSSKFSSLHFVCQLLL